MLKNIDISAVSIKKLIRQLVNGLIVSGYVLMKLTKTAENVSKISAVKKKRAELSNFRLKVCAKIAVVMSVKNM